MKKLWVVILAMLCSIVGGIIVAQADQKPVSRTPSVDHSKMGHGPSDDHWTAPLEQARRKNPVPKDAASIARGKKVYADYCASCHGVGGRGDGAAGKALDPKPTDLAAMAPQHSAGDLAWKIETGRGPMPSWKNVLSANQIWDVVNYMHSLGGKPKTKSKAVDPHAGHAH